MHSQGTCIILALLCGDVCSVARGTSLRLFRREKLNFHSGPCLRFAVGFTTCHIKTQPGPGCLKDDAVTSQNTSSLGDLLICDFAKDVPCRCRCCPKVCSAILTTLVVHFKGVFQSNNELTEYHTNTISIHEMHGWQNSKVRKPTSNPRSVPVHVCPYLVNLVN